MICAMEAYRDWIHWSRLLRACKCGCTIYMTALISDFQKVSEFSDDFQNLLICDPPRRITDIRNNVFGKKMLKSNECSSIIIPDRRVHIMDDYKKLIIEMLDHADDRRLFLIYTYVKAILGLR
nr:MAG TPA: hypothetical protein [Caudoviricetes sp.]